MHEYFIRCHYGVSIGELQKVCKEFEEKFDDVFICRELKGRPHIHAYVKTELKDSRIRQIFKAALKPEKSGNAGLSVKPWDEKQGGMRYMCKGEMETGRGDTVNILADKMGRMVQQLHEAYWDQRESYKKDDGEKASKKSFIRQLIDEAKAKGITDKEGVMRLIVQNRFVAEKGFDEFMVVKWFWPVYMGVNAQAEDDLVMRCMDRIRG